MEVPPTTVGPGAQQANEQVRGVQRSELTPSYALSIHSAYSLTAGWVLRPLP